MKQFNNDLFLTTNQDYGSFYYGRLQHGRTNPDKIACELAINDQVRSERRQIPSIAYDIMFDKHDSPEIVNHAKNKHQPITARCQLKYRTANNRTNKERQIIIKEALESYSTFVQCIYANKPEKNPHSSNSLLELVAYELFFLNPEISADELAESMVAIIVPHEYLGMSDINPNKPYPGTESECTKTPRLRRLLAQFQRVKEMVVDSKQHFNSAAISSQPLHGVRYIYKPFTNSMSSQRI